MRANALIMLAAALTLAACGNNKPLGQGFGDSVRHNMAVHIINPRPDYKLDALDGHSGRRAAGAMGRYETGTVKELRIEKTSRKATAQ
jgi:hypothetical protein